MRTHATFSKRITGALLAGALLGSGAAQAQDAVPPSPPPASDTAKGAPVVTKPYVGEVVRTADGRLTVTRENSAPISFRLVESARVLLNGRPARLEDLQPGDRVRVDPHDRDALFAVTITAERAPAVADEIVEPAVEVVAPATREIQPGLGLTFAASPAGVMVTGVVPGGPADRVEIRPGDYILAVNSSEVNTPAGTLALIRELPPGNTINLKVWRDGQQSDMAVVLGNAGGAPDTIAVAGTPRVARRVAVAPDAGFRLIRTDAGAVQVAEVIEGSAADLAGLREGDVILSVDGTRVATPATVTDLINAAEEGVGLMIVRAGTTAPVELALTPLPRVAAAPAVALPADSPAYVRLLLERQQAQEQALERLFREVQSLRTEVIELRTP